MKMKAALLVLACALSAPASASSFVGFGCISAQHTSLHVGDHVVFSGSGWAAPVSVYWDDVHIATYPGPSFTNYDGTCGQGTGNPYFTIPFFGPGCASKLRAVSGATEVDIDMYGVVGGVVVFSENNSTYPQGSSTCLVDPFDLTPGSGVVVISENGDGMVNDQETKVVIGPLPVHQGQTVYLGLANDRLLPLTSAQPIEDFPPLDPNAQTIDPFGGDTVISGFAKTDGNLTIAGNLMLHEGVIHVNGDLWIEKGIGEGPDKPDGGLHPRATGAIFVTGRAVVHGPVYLETDDATTIYANKDVYLCGNGTYTAGPCARATSGDANGDGKVDVSDVFSLINRLFAGGPAPVGLGDVNGDGFVNVSDVFYLINALFASGPAPK